MMDTNNIPLFVFFQDRFPGRFASELIYHYTTGGMLETFIQDDADFYCTYYASLNDGHEIIEGWDAVPTYFEEVCEIPTVIVDVIRQKCHEVFQLSSPWLMSFSDQKDSLSQWGMYTDRTEGGYAFGFDWRSLRERIIEVEQTLPPQRHALLLSPCFYTVGDVKDMLDFFWGKHRDIIQRLKSSSFSTRDLANVMMKVQLLSSIIKHVSFIQEQEWRLVKMAADEGFAACEFVGSKPRLKTMIFDREHPLRNYLREIVVSPHGKSDVLMMNAMIMCKKYGLQIPVTRSSSPYNGR